jgi:hypothetical protein
MALAGYCKQISGGGRDAVTAIAGSSIVSVDDDFRTAMTLGCPRVHRRRRRG